jgi:excisionase family DNA binding protein
MTARILAGNRHSLLYEANARGDAPALLTLPEAAAILRLKLSTLRAWRLRRRHLEFVTVGGKVLVTRGSIEAFVERNLIAPAAEPVRKPVVNSSGENAQSLELCHGRK